MIGEGGIGKKVMKGIKRINVGIGLEGGMEVVIMEVIIDRIKKRLGKGGKGMIKRIELLKREEGEKNE